MNHKAGDTVRIRSREWIDAQEKDEDGDIMRDNGFSRTMFQYAGKLAVITYVDTDDSYRLDIDDGSWWWADWMFDPGYRSADGPLSAEDAVRAMLDGERLTDDEGTEYFWDADWDGGHFFYRKRDETDAGVAHSYTGLYRRSAKRKRLMTRFEILGWANSEASRGWVVRTGESGEWFCPPSLEYCNDIDVYQRARLLPDLSGVDKDTIQGFEVEE
jgi:hypothetical protein